MPKPIPQNGTRIRFNVSDGTDQTPGRSTDHFRARWVPHNVVILHPSFGCPAIVEAGKKITLYVLTDKDFQNLYDKDPDPKKPWVKAAINAMLKILPWSDDKQI